MRTLAITLLTLLAFWPQPLLLRGQQVIIARRRVVSAGGCSGGSYTDNFTRADGPLGAPYNLVSPSGAINIVSNTAQPAAFSSGDQFAAITGCTGFTQAQYAEVIATGTGNGQFGAVVEVSDATHGAVMRCGSGLGGCYMLDLAGNFIGFFGGTIADGDKACITVSGTTVTFWLNGVNAGSGTVASVPNGVPGIYFNGQTATVAAITSFKAGNGTVCP